MRVLVVTTQVPFVRGGAELHAENLVTELQRAGHEAALTAIPFRWYPPAKLLDHLLACRLLDLSESNGVKVDRVIGLKFPAYHLPHPNKVLWILHQQRPLFDLWETPDADLAFYPEGRDIRETVVSLEVQLLSEARALHANSRNVAERLRRHTGYEATPLYHPPSNADQFRTEEAERYLFYPSRLCGLKRQELVLRALVHTRRPVQLVFAGQPDEPGYLRELSELARSLGVHQRVQWLGQVSEETKRHLYARCLAVVFPPLDEDYGYITLEAMLSSKPVITCTDSGGPLEFIRDGQTGRISEPSAEALAAVFDELWDDPNLCRVMGQNGRDLYSSLHINWPHVINTLIDAD